MALGLEQQQQQMEMMQQQQQQAQQAPAAPPGVNQAPGRIGAAPGGGEGGGATPAPAVPLQQMMNGDGLEKDAKKFGGRFAGVTPDWHDKSPLEEDNVDDIADARAEGKSWMSDLFDKGYTSPLIKEVNTLGTKMWFAQDGVDFVADLNAMGVTHIEKASFGQGPIYKPAKGPSEKPVISYSPTGNNKQGEYPYEGAEENNANL